MVSSLTSQEVIQFSAWLQNEFDSRRRVNPQYSLRAFAKKLDLAPSTVSRILTGKRNISKKILKKIEEKLERKFLFEDLSSDSNYHLLQEDMFSFISDWHHYAILDLLLLKNFQSDIGWIAKKMNLDRLQVTIAIERMKRLGVLAEQNGRFIKTKKYFTNYQEGQTSSSLKEYQRQVIQKSLEAVDSCSPEIKDITSMTIAGNSKKINKAKKLIRKFRRDLMLFMEDGDGDHVFHFALQLYPVSGSTKD